MSVADEKDTCKDDLTPEDTDHKDLTPEDTDRKDLTPEHKDNLTLDNAARVLFYDTGVGASIISAIRRRFENDVCVHPLSVGSTIDSSTVMLVLAQEEAMGLPEVASPGMIAGRATVRAIGVRTASLFARIQSLLTEMGFRFQEARSTGHPSNVAPRWVPRRTTTDRRYNTPLFVHTRWCPFLDWIQPQWEGKSCILTADCRIQRCGHDDRRAKASFIDRIDDRLAAYIANHGLIADPKVSLYDYTLSPEDHAADPNELRRYTDLHRLNMPAAKPIVHFRSDQKFYSRIFEPFCASVQANCCIRLTVDHIYLVRDRDGNVCAVPRLDKDPVMRDVDHDTVVVDHCDSPESPDSTVSPSGSPVAESAVPSTTGSPVSSDLAVPLVAESTDPDQDIVIIQAGDEQKVDEGFGVMEHDGVLIAGPLDPKDDELLRVPVLPGAPVCLSAAAWADPEIRVLESVFTDPVWLYTNARVIEALVPPDAVRVLRLIVSDYHTLRRSMSVRLADTAPLVMTVINKCRGVASPDMDALHHLVHDWPETGAELRSQPIRSLAELQAALRVRRPRRHPWRRDHWVDRVVSELSMTPPSQYNRDFVRRVLRVAAAFAAQSKNNLNGIELIAMVADAAIRVADVTTSWTQCCQEKRLGAKNMSLANHWKESVRVFARDTPVFGVLTHLAEVRRVAEMDRVGQQMYLRYTSHTDWPQLLSTEEHPVNIIASWKP